MNINKNELKKFNDQGFIIIKSKEIRVFKDNLTSYLSTIILDVVRVLNIEIDTKSLIGKTFSEQMDFIINNERDNSISKILYEIFPSLSPVLAVVNDDLIVNISKDLAVRIPVPSTIPLIRIDRPNGEHFATMMHQDYWYSMLCDNAIVMWMPLVPITSEMGLIEIIPESHKNGLVAFKNHDGNEPYTTVDDYTNDAKKPPVKVEYDEILIFNKYLLHFSGKNYSSRARVTLQVRFNDLETMDSITSSFTAVHSTFVKSKQNSFVSH